MKAVIEISNPLNQSTRADRAMEQLMTLVLYTKYKLAVYRPAGNKENLFMRERRKGKAKRNYSA